MRKLSFCELNHYNYIAVITVKNNKKLPVPYIKNLLRLWIKIPRCYFFQKCSTLHCSFIIMSNVDCSFIHQCYLHCICYHPYKSKVEVIEEIAFVTSTCDLQLQPTSSQLCKSYSCFLFHIIILLWPLPARADKDFCILLIETTLIFAITLPLREMKPFLHPSLGSIYGGGALKNSSVMASKIHWY